MIEVKRGIDWQMWAKAIAAKGVEVNVESGADDRWRRFANLLAAIMNAGA